MIHTKSAYRYKALHWKAFNGKRSKYLLSVQRLVKAALNRSLQPVLDAIEDGEDAPESKADRAAIVTLYAQIYPLVGTEFAIDTYNQVSGMKAYRAPMRTKDRIPDSEASTLESYFQRFLRNYALTQSGDKITAITETTRKIIRSVLSQAASEGLSIPQTVRLMATSWQQTTAQRARVIARTEIVSISNLSSLEGAKQTGLQLNKVWLSTKDSRTRSRHSEVDGQTVDINAPFIVGGEQLRHPGDSGLGASAANTIMCRCTQYFQPKGG